MLLGVPLLGHGDLAVASLLAGVGWAAAVVAARRVVLELPTAAAP